jgi:acetate kinase
MKTILVINCGSSSLKFELFTEGKEPKSLAEGLIDKIGKSDCKLTFKTKGKNLGLNVKVKNHTEAVRLAYETLDKPKIDLVGHRVVHGGEKYSSPVKIDAKVIKTLKKLSHLAPLHNPINLEGITACKKLFPRAKQVAIFDTAFHHTMPPKAYLYALPRDLYDKHAIRRYGFHGTNHKYVTEKTIRLLNKKSGLKIISCHLGNGSSVTASVGGKVIDTSMGFTPLEGIPMGTRCGSIDPAIVLEIQKVKKLTPLKTDHYLNHECGLLGFSGISSDMREIYEASLKKDKDAISTIEFLSYCLAKQIGAYTAALNGLDALVFTAGIGEKAFYVREKTCKHLSHLGLILDKTKNKSSQQLISSTKSKTKVFVIKADEEYQIAKESIKAK